MHVGKVQDDTAGGFYDYVSWRTTWPVLRNCPSCCAILTVNHSYPSYMLFLKWLTVSFEQRATRASLENSFHAIGLFCKTRIFRPAIRVLLANGLLAFKAEIFRPIQNHETNLTVNERKKRGRPYTQSGPSLKLKDLRPMLKTIVARINPKINIIFLRSWREIYHLMS